MIVVNLNGVRKEIPGCFEELTTRQYERIMTEWEVDKPLAERNYFTLFNILADTNFKGLEENTENEVTVWNAIKWFIEDNYQFSEELPTVLQVNLRTLTIPRRISKLSIGQNIHLKQLLTKSKYLEEQLSAACAIYLQPLYDSAKFDFDRAMELKKDIEKMPVYLVRPVGFFLLMSALPNGGKRVRVWQRILNSLKQSKEKILLCLRGFPGYSLSRI